MKKFGPPAGCSNGYQFAMRATSCGEAFGTNAYRSVVSTAGSFAMSGASRWLDALTGRGTSTAAVVTATPAAASRMSGRRGRPLILVVTFIWLPSDGGRSDDGAQAVSTDPSLLRGAQEVRRSVEVGCADRGRCLERARTDYRN